MSFINLSIDWKLMSFFTTFWAINVLIMIMVNHYYKPAESNSSVDHRTPAEKHGYIWIGYVPILIFAVIDVTTIYAVKGSLYDLDPNYTYFFNLTHPELAVIVLASASLLWSYCELFKQRDKVEMSAMISSTLLPPTICLFIIPLFFAIRCDKDCGSSPSSPS